MGLGVPGRITELHDGPVRTVVTDLDGVSRAVGLACALEAAP